jgi:Cu(I)/Ag(I) efflux system membrane protein CusA/SilA
MMTVVAIMAGLLPIMWGTGTGSEVMRRIAAPMVGGMVSSTVLTLVVIPAIYGLVKEFGLRRGEAAPPRSSPSPLAPLPQAGEGVEWLRSPTR